MIETFITQKKIFQKGILLSVQFYILTILFFLPFVLGADNIPALVYVGEISSESDLCEKWMEENLELELRVSGSIEPVQNKIRLILRLHNPQTKTLIQSKTELKSVNEYNESITKRKTAALLKNIEKNIKVLDQRVRQDKQDSDKLLDYLQTYNSLLKDLHSNGVNNPEVLDGLLSRISKLEYLVVSSYEKRAEQHEYFGKYKEGLKDLEKLKNNSKIKCIVPMMCI